MVVLNGSKNASNAHQSSRTTLNQKPKETTGNQCSEPVYEFVVCDSTKIPTRFGATELLQ